MTPLQNFYEYNTAKKICSQLMEQSHYAGISDNDVAEAVILANRVEAFEKQHGMTPQTIGNYFN